MEATIFTRNNCAACHGTIAQFVKLGIPFTEVNIEDPGNEAIAQELVDDGWRTMPVVKTANESWSGTQIDRIRALA